MTRENEEMTSTAEQAAQWWVLFGGGEVSSSDKREFVEWVTRAPERVEASLRVARVHAAVSRSDLRWPKTPAETLIRDALSEQEDAVVPLRPHVSRVREERPRRRVMPVALGLAASVVLAVCLGWWFTLSRPEQFQTRIGEQHSVMLSDGSRVTLNTASQIAVRLQPDHRGIELTRGEALFEVAHDVNRPFDVRVGDVVVRAVGTQFDIDRRETRTVITVIEGRVAMLAAGARKDGLPVLSAGDRVVFDSAGLGQIQHGVNLSHVTAWIQRQLVFQHRSLGEVAEEFNRYSTGKIDIRSQALREQEVTGTFRSDDVASFVAVLAGIPGVRVASDGAGGYVVTSDDSASPRQ